MPTMNQLVRRPRSKSKAHKRVSDISGSPQKRGVCLIVRTQQLKHDTKLNSRLASKFINALMLAGKKSAAQSVFCDALDIISKKIADVGPLEVFEKAINNVKQLIEVRSK